MGNDYMGKVSIENLFKTIVKCLLKSFTLSLFSIFVSPNNLYKKVVVFHSLNFPIKTFSKSSQLVMELGGRLNYHVEAFPMKV
jgi:hypothetical protein